MARKFTPFAILFLLIGSLTLVWRQVRADEAADAGPGGPPFANDAGPDQLDVSKYPEEIQADYHKFAQRCSQCHTLARPINSQYLQLTADEQKEAKEKEPELLTNDKIWHVGDNVWADYVTKMKSKPGAIIRASEFDKIVAFLVYDSKVRKTGANREEWKAQRQKLLDDFKAKNPKRYSELYGKP